MVTMLHVLLHVCCFCVPVSECCETNACVLVCLPLSKTGSWWAPKPSSVDFKVKTNCRHNIQTAENFSRSVVSRGHLHVVGEVRTEEY